MVELKSRNRMKEETLLSLLKKKKGFFEAILDLTEQETQSSVEHWQELLQKKQILLGCIEDIDSQLKNFEQSMHTLSYDVIEQLKDLHCIISQIMELGSLNLKEKKKHLS